ncbi:hypothetical protein SAMN06264849_1028 [Melghirimyces algeriensis]|uniref:Uncharacterized protein n=1 Tax=Melghirimyces algeriensis TaxID=910412 RepID=A0A521BCU9_9BACL|nr:hypothetical protein SAMN06264849_1028 [Melghirimyces algeriensis]
MDDPDTFDMLDLEDMTDKQEIALMRELINRMLKEENEGNSISDIPVVYRCIHSILVIDGVQITANRIVPTGYPSEPSIGFVMGTPVILPVFSYKYT